MNSFNEAIAQAVAATGAFELEQAKKLITVPTDTEHGNFTLPCFVLAQGSEGYRRRTRSED